jgi:hypothetical protein
MPTLEIPDELVAGDPLQISSAASLFTAENFVAWMLFGAIGFVAFMYGKKMGRLGPLILGLLLMIYPYFVTNTWLLYGVGALFTTGLFYWKE